MKMIKLVILLFVFLSVASCSIKSPENRTSTEFAYDYKGILIEKAIIGHSCPRYFFIIQDIEDTNIIFEHETDIKSYVNRNVGDTVVFEYIRLDRLN